MVSHWCIERDIPFLTTDFWSDLIISFHTMIYGDVILLNELITLNTFFYACHYQSSLIELYINTYTYYTLQWKSSSSFTMTLQMIFITIQEIEYPLVNIYCFYDDISTCKPYLEILPYEHLLNQISNHNCGDIWTSIYLTKDRYKTCPTWNVIRKLFSLGHRSMFVFDNLISSFI